MRTQKLKILGHEYEVREDHRARTEKETPGAACMVNCWIELDPEAPQSRYEEALLHEIIEVLRYHLALEFPHDKLLALSEGLFQVLSDNNMKTNWRVAMNSTLRTQ